MPAPASECRFAASLSTSAETADAIAAVGRDLAARLGGPADLVVAFVSPHHARGFDRLGDQISAATGARVLLGATGESIVGGDREIEGEPALSAWGARLPGTTLRPFALEFQATPEGPVLTGWPDDLPEPWPDDAALVVLGEPFSFPADLLAQRLNEDRPGVPLVGGMASGGTQPGENRLWLGDEPRAAGAVAVWLAGGVRVRTVVSQGCRPIGQSFVITKAERNVIYELGGRPPLEQFQAVFAQLPPAEQALVRQGLHLGRVTNEYRGTFGRGDFLIRNVMGADQKSGAIAVGDYFRPGQTVQFHVRDASSADEDLREMLAGLPPAAGRARGGLLFTCNGRGSRLFPEPHHDAQAIQAALDSLPLAGFFAQGELGPIGGQNFIHGFTASLAVFEELPTG